MAETKKFCIHSDGLGYCDVLSDYTVPHYCVEGPCPHEIIVEYDPVRHGRWIKHEGYDECNLCHTKTIFGHNYCPNCGAKMEVDNG